MTVIIAFTGKRGSGKDTAAEALKSLDYVHINFADPLRRITHTAYGVTYEEMSDPILKEMVLDRYPYKSPRELLTIIGTELFRDYIDDTWVQAFEREARKHSHVVLSDLRFLNEEIALRKLNATLVRVSRPSLVRPDDDAVSKHRSEMEMDQIKVDFEITNRGTVEDLWDAARIMESIDEQNRGV